MGEGRGGAGGTLKQVAAWRCCEEETEVDVNKGPGCIEQYVAVVTVFHRQNVTNNTEMSARQC